MPFIYDEKGYIKYWMRFKFLSLIGNKNGENANNAAYFQPSLVLVYNQTNFSKVTSE